MKGNKKIIVLIVILVIIAIAIVSVIGIMNLGNIKNDNTTNNNNQNTGIEIPGVNQYAVPNDSPIIQFHTIQQEIVSYYGDIEILTKSEEERETWDYTTTSYSFEELTRLFKADYEKMCKVYDKAIEQVKDNVKITIQMENYKKNLDIVYEGITTGQLYEQCNNPKYIEALQNAGSAGNDFIFQFVTDYMKQ